MRNDEHWGFKSYCNTKQLNVKQVLDLFCAEKNLPRPGIREYIDNHWKEFAAFVNEKLQKKEIHGVNRTTSNGSEERKQENRLRYKALDQGLRAWWEVMQQKDGGTFNTGRMQILQKFFQVNGLGSTPKKHDGDFQPSRYEPIYQVIKQNNLLEEFKQYKI